MTQGIIGQAENRGNGVDDFQPAAAAFETLHD
jgi:hypothetical protein